MYVANIAAKVVDQPWNGCKTEVDDFLKNKVKFESTTVTRNTNNVIVVDCLDQHHVAIVALHNGSELPNLRCQV